MSFLEDVHSYKPKTGPACSVKVWREVQDPDTVTEFDATMTDPSTTAKAIWLAMRVRGFDRAVQAVTHHRNGECSCRSPQM